jgi:branched-chain amino acid transport system substrate-binding protein
MAIHRLKFRAALLASSLGFAALSSAAIAGDYTIGVIVPLSGQAAFIGESALRAMTLRAEQINAQGGINGHKLKLEAQDDKCDPNAAVNIAQRFVNGSDVVGVLGPFCSAASVAVKPIFARAKTVDLTVASTADAITQGTNWSFQVAAPDNVYATTLANYAADHGKRIAVLNDTSAFGLGAYATVEKVLKDRKVEMVAHEQITAGQPDVSPQVLKLKQADADFVVALVLGGDAAKLCITSRNLGFKAQLAGQTAWSFPNVLSLSNGACDGAIFTDPFDPAKPEAKALLDAFEKRWNERPQSYFPAAGWDALNLWAEAAKSAGSASSDGIDQTKLLAALNNIKGYKGAIGVGGATISFSEGNHIALGVDGTHLRRIAGDKLLPLADSK